MDGRTAFSLPDDDRHDPALDRLLAGFRLPAAVAGAVADRFRAEAAAAGRPETAAERAEAALGAWFAEVLGSPERALSRGRTAFLIAGGPQHFADRLLADPVPAGLAEALRRACPAPLPEAAPRAMPEQSLAAPRRARVPAGRLARIPAGSHGRGRA
jgi:hypothetical protein